MEQLQVSATESSVDDTSDGLLFDPVEPNPFNLLPRATVRYEPERVVSSLRVVGSMLLAIGLVAFTVAG